LLSEVVLACPEILSEAEGKRQTHVFGLVDSEGKISGVRTKGGKKLIGSTLLVLTVMGFLLFPFLNTEKVSTDSPSVIYALPSLLMNDSPLSSSRDFDSRLLEL